jgi:hypothetical protein
MLPTRLLWGLCELKKEKKKITRGPMEMMRQKNEEEGRYKGRKTSVRRIRIAFV